jgi:hypothetical protein
MTEVYHACLCEINRVGALMKCVANLRTGEVGSKRVGAGD